MNVFLNTREKSVPLTDISATLYWYTDHKCLCHSFLSSKLLYLHLHCLCHLSITWEPCLCRKWKQRGNMLRQMLPTLHPSADSNYQPSRWRQQVSLKRRYIFIIHFSIKFKHIKMLFLLSGPQTVSICALRCWRLFSLVFVKVNLMTCLFPKDTRVSFTQNAMEGFSASILHQFMLQGKMTLRTNSSNYRMYKNKRN